jgi:hypothetical protein
MIPRPREFENLLYVKRPELEESAADPKATAAPRVIFPGDSQTKLTVDVFVRYPGLIGLSLIGLQFRGLYVRLQQPRRAIGIVS